MDINPDKSIPKRLTYTDDWYNVITEKDWAKIPFSGKFIVLTDEEIEYLYNRIKKQDHE